MFRTALITGASRGLGAALARALARQGTKVALVARGRAALEAVVTDIRADGGEAHAIVADVGDKDAVHGIAGAAAALVGPIELLVQNASTLGPVPLRPLLDTDCEDLEHALQVNVVGPFRLGKIVAGAMAMHGGGTVVHVSSDAAVEAYPEWGAYSASKAAFDHLGRVWARELEPRGVRFLMIDPGEMDTRMHADAIPSADPATLADPRDVAAGILRLLASDLPSGTRTTAASAPEASRPAVVDGPRAEAGR